jgi:hypothetical protein
MYRNAALVALVFAASTAAHAQVVVSTTDMTAAARPALISDTSLQSNDSPLVQAAKRSVARRRAAGATTTFVIDNRNVRNSTKTLTTSSGMAALPDYSNEGRSGETGLVPNQPAPIDRAALQQKAVALQQELQRRMDDEDQGPYGEGNEDRNEQRMTEGTRELNQTNTTLNTSPAPPTPRANQP